MIYTINPWPSIELHAGDRVHVTMGATHSDGPVTILHRVVAFTALQYSTVRRLSINTLVGDVVETKTTFAPWNTVVQIAEYVRGDGTDPMRQALADGILEGRRA